MFGQEIGCTMNGFGHDVSHPGSKPVSEWRPKTPPDYTEQIRDARLKAELEAKQEALKLELNALRSGRAAAQEREAMHRAMENERKKLEAVVSISTRNPNL